jgi:divalent metal cation (Fe/Co/Zn/Cd) transporter
MKVSPTTSRTAPIERGRDLARASRLEYVSVGYNVLEAVAGIAFGLVAGSVALVGFGLDSVVEASSATILLWRLRTEVSGRRTAAEAEGRAIRLVALAFFALAAYVGARSVWDLLTGARPEESIPGIVLAAASLVIMPILARAKRRLATSLDSRSLKADSMQTVLCTYLSAFLLVGLAANSLWGWWWADPAAGLAIAVIAVREGIELWRERDLCC